MQRCLPGRAPTAASPSPPEPVAPLPGGKNIMRGCFLAFLATFCGCFFLYTLPDAIAAQLGRVMPFWFYEGQVRRVPPPETK